MCLFETCSKEKPSALSCIQVQMLLYSVNVFFRQELKLGHWHDDVRSLGLFRPSVNSRHRLISVMKLELAEVGKPAHLVYFIQLIF